MALENRDSYELRSLDVIDNRVIRSERERLTIRTVILIKRITMLSSEGRTCISL